MNAVSSLNVNVLPANTVCAVSPAQNNPFGLLQSDRITAATKGLRQIQLILSPRNLTYGGYRSGDCPVLHQQT